MRSSIAGMAICFAAGIVLGAGVCWRFKADRVSLPEAREIVVAGNQEAKAASPGAPKSAHARKKDDVIKTRLSRDEIISRLKQIDGLSSFKARSIAMDELAESLAVEDIPVVLDCLSLMREEEERVLFAETLLTSWAESNPQEAMAYAQSVSKPKQEQYVLAVVESWVNSDPAATMEWAKKLPIGRLRSSVLECVLPAIGRANPMEALALIGDTTDYHLMNAAAGVFSIWAETDPTKAAEELLRHPLFLKNETILDSILITWVHDNADQAFEWIKALPGGAIKDNAYSTAVINLASNNPEKAMALAMTIPSGGRQNQMVSDVINRWTKSDLNSALAWCQNLPVGKLKSDAMDTIINQWVVDDPHAAAGYIQEMPRGKRQQENCTKLCQAMAASDVTAGMAWAEGLPAGELHDFALQEMVKSWSRVDSQAAMQYMQQNPQTTFPPGAVAVVVGEWSKTDPNGAMKWILEGTGNKFKLDYGWDIAEEMVEKNPKVAAELCNKLPSTDKAKYLIERLADTYASQDLMAAVEWAKQYPTKGLSDIAVGSLFNKWVDQDFSAATAYAMQLEPGSHQSALLESVASEWGDKDPGRVLQFYQQLPDEELRNRMMQSMGKQLADNSPEAASEFVGKMDSGVDKANAISGVAEKWQETDPEGTAKWLLTTSSDNQSSLLGGATAKWAEQEPTTAAQWIAEMQPGPLRDSAVAGFLEGASQTFPDYAAKWTESISNDQERWADQLTVARNWLQVCEPAAKEWIKTLNWPDSIKQEAFKKND